MGMFVGLPVLQYLFDRGYRGDVPQGTIYLQYPENWLNTIELRSLTRLLGEKLPGQPVRILTHSEHIVCTVRKENVYILDDAFPEEDAIQGRRLYYGPQSPSIYSNLPTYHSTRLKVGTNGQLEEEE